MISLLPPEPAVPATQTSAGELPLRYEDVTQDGHLVVEAAPTALGEVWRRLEGDQRAALGSERGVLPILSRLIVESGEGPISVFDPNRVRGLYQLAHTRDEGDRVDRIILGMWASVGASIGRTQGEPPADVGRPVVAARVFAEHVFTRPFGPPDQRKVRALILDGSPVVPPDRWIFRGPEASLELPEGALPLDAEPVPDTTFTVFGLDHTDSNQHVNSLVYTRLFIEAALRRLDAHGHARALRARVVEIAYRKPSFAGERVRPLVRAFRLGEELGVTVALVTDEEASERRAGARPRVFARMIFARAPFTG